MKYDLEFAASPEDYAKAVQFQRVYAQGIVDKLDRGEPIDATDGYFVAPILRAWADNLKDTPPRKRGKAPRVGQAEVAVHHALLVSRGKSKSSAISELAELGGVTDEAVRKIVKKHGAAAACFVSLMNSGGFVDETKKGT